MKHLTLKSALIAATLGTSCLMSIGTLVASSFEWVDALTYTPGTLSSFKWHTNTAGNFYEYRSLYYAYPWSPNTWTEITKCRHHGYVNGQVIDQCTFPNLTPTSTTLIFRATTNYAACGTWTPNPDTVNCGGIDEITTLYP